MRKCTKEVGLEPLQLPSVRGRHRPILHALIDQVMNRIVLPSAVNLPASIVSLRGYTKNAFLSDLLAGITVGLVALPLAMAFAIASGLPPESGIYCAVIAGFTISALGGSTTQ